MGRKTKGTRGARGTPKEGTSLDPVADAINEDPKLLSIDLGQLTAKSLMEAIMEKVVSQCKEKNIS